MTDYGRGSPILVPSASINMSTSGTKISKRVEKELHQRKVIIRRLPPDFTEEKLREKIDPFPDHVYFYFCPGDPTLGNLGFSRAYIAFEREEDILPFRNCYDGMMLEGVKGGKYRAIVEFAPYQGVPKKPKRKVDVRCGTIDKDPDYQAFIQSLESRPEPRPSVQLESYLEELAASRVMDVQVTPLIEYLKDRMSGRGGRSRGRGMDAKKKRKGGESASGRSKGYKSSKSGSSGSSGSKSRDSSSKGKKEKESESVSRSGSSTKLAGEEGGNSKSGATQRASSSGRQERKEKYRGSEKKEGEQDGAEGEEKDSRRNKGRNRDRPDRSIYVPRSRNAGGGGGGEKDGRDSSKEYHGRGGRGRQGRHDDSGDYGGRPRSRGRGRGYRRNSGQPQESGY